MVKDITIVSLSRGIIGESFVKHEVEIGLKRLKDYGLNVHFSSNALKGLEYLEKHPESRANDLLEAFNSDTDMILCAIGGDDTYRLLPYLFENNELKNVVKEKIFLGYSDSTINHLMLHKVGLNTFYGQSFLSDICELDKDMLPYTRHYFEELIKEGSISIIEPSDIYYKAREDFSIKAIGSSMVSFKNEGFILVQGSPIFEGEILGGCIDTIYDIFNGDRYSDSPLLCKKYDLFPSLDDWRNKILLLETSEEIASPLKYRNMIKVLKEYGLFDVVSGVLLSKPVDEIYYDDYIKIIKEEINNPNLSIVANINVGHSTPRCIIPFGIKAKVDVDRQIIIFDNKKV